MSYHPSYMSKGHTFQGMQHFGHSAPVLYRDVDHTDQWYNKATWWKRAKKDEARRQHRQDHKRMFEDADQIERLKVQEEAAQQSAQIARDALAVESTAYMYRESQRQSTGISSEDLARIASYDADRDQLQVEVQNLQQSMANAAGVGIGEPEPETVLWPWVLGGIVVIGGAGFYFLNKRKK